MAEKDIDYKKAFENLEDIITDRVTVWEEFLLDHDLTPVDQLRMVERLKVSKIYLSDLNRIKNRFGM